MCPRMFVALHNLHQLFLLVTKFQWEPNGENDCHQLTHGCKFTLNLSFCVLRVCTCTFLFLQLLCTTVSVPSLLSSLSTPLLSSFQASIQKLTWRGINFEALQPPGTEENEREGGKTARNAGRWRGSEEETCYWMFPCNYQVNFTQTFEKTQKVKCELDALPSAEGEVDENKSVR